VRSRGREQGFFLLQSLVRVVSVLFLVLVTVALFACAPQIVGEKHLVPDPLWVQMGNEVREGFLICGSQRSSVGVKYLTKAEFLQLLKAHSKEPDLFDPAPPWVEAITPFLITVTNSSGVPMILEGQHALLRDDKDTELHSLGYTDLYQILSQEKAGEQMIRVPGGLLFSSSPLLAGESRQGLFLFGSLDPKAKKAALTFSFLFGDKSLKTQACLFPFGIEALPPDKGAPAGEGH